MKYLIDHVRGLFPVTKVDVLEAFVASFGILIFGFISIPIAASIVGVSMSEAQGAKMSFLFFAMRIVWLLCVRATFAHGDLFNSGSKSTTPSTD